MSHSSALPRGTRLQNNAYAVGEVLGRGGFGITYKGGDLALKRYVAIKEFFPPGAVRQNNAVVMANSGDLRAGVADFLGEARVLSRFNHAGIVGVAGSFEENNTAYMVMEWIEGETLEARIQSKGRLDEWEVLDIGSRLAGALERIHAATVLHRDIKPENVILRKNGGAVLIDFGTARAFDNSATKMTQIVTPGYAPLEQYAQNARRGPASDIYALAATLYHALSGQKPVAATDRAADVPLVPLQTLAPGLTPMFAGAIMDALQMEISRRPQAANEFAAQLRGQKAPAQRPPAQRPPIPATSQTTNTTNAPNNAADTEFGRQPRTAGEFAAGLRGQRENKGRPPRPTTASELIAATTPVTPAPVTTTPVTTTPVTTTPVTTTPVTTAPNVQGAEINGNLDGVALINTTLKRHTLPVTSLAFAPDGEALISAGADSKICQWLWQKNTYEPGAAWNAHQGGVMALAYSPDGALLASGGRDERINIWDGANLVSADRQPLARLSDCDGVVRDLAFCPVRRELAVADASAVTLWNADTGAIKARRTQGALAVSWAPDGNGLAVCGIMDTELQLWDGNTLAERGRVAAHAKTITGIAWSPDGRLLATTGTDAMVRVWDAAQGTLSWEDHIGGLPECLAWSPDSRLLAVGKTDAVFMRTATGATFRNYTLRRVPGNAAALRGRVEKLRFAPVAKPPYDYILAAAVRDHTIDICRIRLQAGT